MADELIFYLPGRPHGGGVNSVVQEFAGLVEHFGVGRLLVAPDLIREFRDGYALSPEAQSRLTDGGEGIPDGCAVVATTNDSLAQVRERFGDSASRIYYYVQDFEPLFYPVNSRQQQVALSSYGRVHDVVAVVKTQWLANTLLEQTFLPVVRIRPSINRRVYRPPRRHGEKVSLVAMVRPATSRRGTTRTVAVLNRVASTHPDIPVHVFGANAESIADAGLTLHSRINNHGRLSADRAAELVCSAGVLLDLSDYQAFGRTIAEGMAAGVLPVATRYGAPSEFVSHGVNGLLVEPHDLDAAYEAILECASLDPTRRIEWRNAAMDAVAEWTVEATSADWFALMRDA